MKLSVACDGVIHEGLLYKLNLSIGGLVLPVMMQFMRDSPHHVGVNGFFSEWHQMLYGIPQGSVPSSMLYSVYTTDLFKTSKTHFYGYVDDVIKCEYWIPSEASRGF